MKKINTLSIILIGLCLTIFSCKKEDEVKINVPQVKFDIPTMGYTTYINENIDIKPVVTNASKTQHSWLENDKEISKEATLHYSSDKSSIHIIKYIASNEAGKTENTINIEVLDIGLPKIEIAQEEFSIKQTKELIIEAKIESIRECKYSWKELDKELSADKTLKFSSSEIGTHTIIFTAENAGGKSEKTIIIKVISAVKAKVTLPDNKTDFSLKNGETIEIKPVVETDVKTRYSWTLNGNILAETKDLTYTASKNGLSKLIFKAINIGGETRVDIRLLVGIRTETDKSSNTITKVFDFTPAPGQFINEGYDCNTMYEANAYAMKSLLNKDFYLSLGGFGGYVIMGFDHSIVDNEKQDIMIKGNSFDGSSEPGIIWVMQDENNNGKPDDKWYQLKGSEYGKPETTQNYSITYTRPSAVGQDVVWTDNQGNNGCIDYLIYHKQSYYYPKWIKSDSYTLTGPRLKGKVTEEGGIYRNNVYDWGYVDNKDHVKDGNLFELKNAIDENGKAIELGFIDFIKVQNAVNEKAGWIGENSTEIYYVEDIK